MATPSWSSCYSPAPPLCLRPAPPSLAPKLPSRAGSLLAPAQPYQCRAAGEYRARLLSCRVPESFRTWKLVCDVNRFNMDESVDFVKSTAGEVKELMSWEIHRSSAQHRKMFKAHPGPQRMPAVSELQLSDNQFLFKKPVSSLDESFQCPALNPLCNPHGYPGTSSSESSLASGDNLTLRQSTKVLLEKHISNGHSRNHVHAVCATSDKPRPGRSLYLESRKTPSGTLDTIVGKSNHHHVSAYEKSFPIKPTASPSWGTLYRRSPKKAQRRCISTAEETVREDEKEIYRQLLQVVTGKSFLTTKTPSIFPSHLPRCMDSSNHLPKPPVSTTKTKSLQACAAAADPAASVVSAHIPPPAQTTVPFPLSSYSTNDGTYCGSKFTSTSHRHQNNVVPFDTQSEGSDSVIEIDDDVKTPEAQNVPFFQGELWIKELTSLYDSRARERCRQIEEQKALALQLQNQRLQEHSVQDSVDLRLRVPLEKELPVVQEKKVPAKIAAEEEFPELNQEMLKEIRRAFTGGNQDEILSEAFRLTITRKDILTLNNLNWLNDEIINFFMNLLMERSKRKGLPKVHAFNTFFFTKVKSAGYHAVKRWTKKIDLFSVDVILVPIHLGVHWCLAVVDFRKKSITYYDSMGGYNNEACKILLQYLKQESLDKKGKDFDTNGWQLVCKRSQEIPQQMNGSDCGMFACKYADYITKDKPITFTQQHMPYFRKRMVWEILHQKLL